MEMDELIQYTINNPFDYNGFIRAIKELTKKSDIQNLNQIRENMNLTFPLTEELWLNWITDEENKQLNEQKYDFNKLVDLYLKALKDCPVNISIWCKYLDFITVSKHLTTENTRKEFEKSLQKVGLHTSEATLVWNKYRKFEEEILDSLIPDNSENVDLKNPVIKKQLEHIGSIYLRQISIPLAGIEDTKNDYVDFADIYSRPDSEIQSIQDSYSKSIEILHSVQEFEMKIYRIITTQDSINFHFKFLNRMKNFN
eukprot:Anaeramoba_ignava/c19425_g1_i1.p2 GENE.c19425_g1_i1~~c19425_g1_i1.p2  ORF type:complete len:255 (-),score=78.48 c19425_g1_i1:670-1434(-)